MNNFLLLSMISKKKKRNYISSSAICLYPSGKKDLKSLMIQNDNIIDR